MNQCWSETLARFFYELKQQQNKRSELTTLLQVIVNEIVEHEPGAKMSSFGASQRSQVNSKGAR